MTDLPGLHTPLDDGPFGRLVLGLWRVRDWGLDSPGLAARLREALDLGITTLDLADIYGDYRAEAVVGEAFRHDPGLAGAFRLVTKCGIALRSPNRPGNRVKHYDTSPDHIRHALSSSLDALGVDAVDTLLIHRPDPLMEAGVVAATFAELARSGRVRQFGVSNFAPSQFDLLAAAVEAPLVTNQIELSLLAPGALEDGTLDQCQRLGIPPMIWSPLGGGALFDESPAYGPLRTALERVAAETGAASTAQVALAWVLAHPSRPAALVGSGRPARWQEAVDALSLPLTRQQWFELLEAARGHEVP